MKKVKGFSYFELILYVAILGFFVTTVVSYGWSAVFGGVRSAVEQEVSQNLRFVTHRINYEVRNSSGINSATSGSLSLSYDDSLRNPTIIDLSDGRVRIGYGSSGDCPVSSPCFLTSNDVTVTTLNFQKIADPLDVSQSVKYTVSLEYNSQSASFNWDKSQTYNSSVMVRGN